MGLPSLKTVRLKRELKMVEAKLAQLAIELKQTTNSTTRSAIILLQGEYLKDKNDILRELNK